MERHLTAGVSVLVALFSAHRDIDQGREPEAPLKAREIERITAYLRGTGLGTTPRPQLAGDADLAVDAG